MIKTADRRAFAAMSALGQKQTVQRKKPGPLYPRKRTFRSALGFLLIRIPLLSSRLTIE